MKPCALPFHRNHGLVGAAAMWLLIAAAVEGETVSLLPTKDNTLFQSIHGDESSGAGESIFAGRTGARNDFRIRRATLAFDLGAAIPANATITDVKLRLYLADAGQNAADTGASLHALTASWGEGTSLGIVGNPGAATTGDATWLHRFHDTVLWSEPGGDFDPEPSAMTIIGSPSQFYEWSGATLLQDVREWVLNPASNFGWILKGEEGEVTTALRFDSRESTIVTNRPQLTVTYSMIPEPADLSLLTTGLILVLGLRFRTQSSGARLVHH